MEAHLKRYEKEVGKKLCVPFSEADILNFMDSNSPPPRSQRMEYYDD